MKRQSIRPKEIILTKSIAIDDSKGSTHNTISEPHNDDSTSTKKFRSIDIYKFADALDIGLMLLGTLSSIASGACLPLLLLIYQQVTDSLVHYGKLKYITENNVKNASQLSCENGGFDVLSNSEDPIAAIRAVVPWYILLGFLSIIFYTIGFSSYMVSAERQIRRIRFRLFRHILYQDMSYFDLLGGKGKLTNTLTDDLLKMKEGIGDKVADFISLLARIIGCLIFALITGWKLTLVIVAVAPLVVIAFNLTIKMTIKYTKQQMQASSQANNIAQEVLAAIRTVTAFNGQQKEYQRYATSLSQVPSIGLKKGFIQGLCQIFSNIAIGIVFTAALWYGQYLIKTECRTYSAGRLVVIFVACINTTWCLNQLVPSLEKFADATAAGSFVFALLSQRSKIDASKQDQGEKPSTFNGEIKFHNVTFNYPARPTQSILQNVHFTIPNGKTVAFVGHSGCGKSTALSLIARLYDPDQGQVLLVDQNIRQLNIEWYRSHIGYVGQEPVLFSGSIEENIRLGKPDATEKEIHEAAIMANAHDFILALPQQYQSSAKGMLSGGQKQRLAIARALIANPKILLLDEATSALDNVSEQKVKDSLNNTRQNRTTIIIAHRLTTIKDADLILVFDKGHIVEQGTHEELLQINNGIYQKLASQLNADDVNEVGEEEEQGLVEDEDGETKKKDGMKREFSRSLSSRITRQISSKINFQRSVSKKKKEEEDEEDEEEEEENIKQSCCHKPFLMILLKLNSPEKYYLFIGCVCSFLFGGVEPVVGLLYSLVYGLFAIPNLEYQSIQTRTLALSIFGIYVFAGLAQFLSTVTFSKASEALILRMRLLTFQAMLRREISWFDNEKNSVGSLITRLSSDTAAFKGLTAIRLNVLFSALGALTLALIFAFMAGWKLTLTVLCFAPIVILSGYSQGRTQSKAGQSKAAKSYAEEAGKYAIEAIQDIRTVATLNQEKFFIQKYEQRFDKDFRNKLGKIPIQALGKAIANSFLYFLQVTAFSYGASLVETNQMGFDKVFQVFIVINFSAMSIGRSVSAMPDYKVAKAAARRILTLCERQSAIDPYEESGSKIANFSGNIEFHDVDFSYPTRRNRRVLNNFSLTCPPGQTTALVGSSGCGKSTTISLLLRFYDPINGRVFLDNHDITTLNINCLRSMIGYVQQEPILFNSTIAENIAYGINDRQVSLEEIRQAAKQANIHDEILRFPEGYETNCGGAGNTQLSGGQKQRIAIARALIRKPKILLLDEATSALDNRSEEIVQKAIDQVRQGRTCLTIAHRLTTIQNSEKIVVVNHGSIAEQGDHEELLRQRGFYYKMQRAHEQQHSLE